MATTPPDFTELFAFCDLHTSRWQLLQHTQGFLSRPMYYDKQGFPIPGRLDLQATSDWGLELPTLAWAMMKEDQDYSRVAWDEFPDGSYLSTVWMGLDQSHGFGEPLIFETMYFSGEVVTNVLPGGPEFTSHPTLEFPDPLGEQGELTTQCRYRTEEEALALHHEIARRIRKRWEV